MNKPDTDEDFPVFESAKPLICERCGGQLAAHGLHCPYCGTRIGTRLYELKIEDHLIHCKDCKHYDGRPCGIVDWYNTADDFCSRAERRTDEQDD